MNKKIKLHDSIIRLKDDTILHIFFGCLIVTIGVIFIIFLLDINNIPTSNGWIWSGDSKSWLGYLVGYAGAVVGAFLGSIATLWAVRLTIESQERARREDNAKSVLPLLAVSEWSGDDEFALDDYDYEDGNIWVTLQFTIKNVGEREMYNVRIGHCYIESMDMKDIRKDLCPVVYKNGHIDCEHFLKLQLPNTDEGGFDLILDVMFQDCYDNQYCQKIKCVCNRASIPDDFRVQRYDIFSAPKRV